jgi:AraC-like DNA-binding protein
VRSLEVRRRLLGNESIREIAYSVGFSHAKELAREFGKVYGVTPSTYRAREKGRADRQPN